jgi:hypothetical protein
MVHPTLHKDLQFSKKSARWVSKLLYEEIKKGQDMQGVHSIKCCRFLTILDNVLAVSESTKVKSGLAGLTVTLEVS